MHAIKRSCVLGLGGSRRFATWAGLGAFVETPSQADWQTLRQKEQKVAAFIKTTEETAAKTQPINWQKWEQTIAHKDILKRMRAHYEQQHALLSALTAKSMKTGKETVEQIGMGWDLFEKALKSCEHSVKQSEALLTSGASALWVSYHNPPVSKLDTNEWLETDPYWQAFLEKHFFYSQYQPAIEDPESPAERDRVKASWHMRMAKFNDRSDTPMLYNFVETFPSWEYYDIHRRTFLEHMVYFLVRKGSDFRFFPETLPWQWLGDIEDQRFKFVSVAQRRRSHFQLSTLARKKALDLLPLDAEHDGAEATLRFLQKETETVTAAVSRLMASFAFLPDPFIPCHTQRAALLAMEGDGARGKFFDLGDDVHCLFYLPEKTARNLPTPKEAFFNILDHLTMTGRRLNPSYATLLDSFADVLSQRGQNWFCAEGECASQAFLRRLRSDDPAREVYCQYFEEMYSRFESAEELNANEMLKRMQEKEKRHLEDLEVYALSTVATSADTAAAAKEQADHLSHLFKNKQLQPLLDADAIVAFDKNGHKIQDAKQIIASFEAFEQTKDLFTESLKTLKEGAAAAPPKA